MAAIGQTQQGSLFRPAAVHINGLRRLRIWGWVFLAPWIIGFIAFTLIPTLASFIFSFTDFNIIHPDSIQFIGLSNYAELFGDPAVVAAAIATLKFALFALPVAVIAPILLAALLNSGNLLLRRLFTTLFYMPYMVPIVSAVFIWQGFLNPTSGWLNQALLSIGITGPDWTNSVDWIYPTMMLIGLWGVGNAMLPTLAGMQGIPTELYEAAKIDGAGAFMSFRRITLPLITPVIFYNLILSVIGIFKYFDIPYIIGRGQGIPGGSTNVFNVLIYRTAFTYQRMGYSSTLAWVLFVVAMAVTLFLFATSRYWVYYSSERN